MNALAEKPTSQLGAWILASRPATLTAAIVPVLVGTACAYAIEAFRPLPALGALLGAIWIQIGTNFANDTFDYEKGADTEERIGPTRAVQAGLLSAAQMRRGMIVSFGVAALCGLYLMFVAGPWILAIGVASVASGIAYTGGPYPLGYNGLGDLFVMIFFGFVAVCGTTFVQSLSVPPLALLASIPVGALATAILVVNNVRDRHTDVSAGKRTLVVRFGYRVGLAEYMLLLLASYATPLVLWALGDANAWILLPLASLPYAALNAGRMLRLDGKELNPVLGSTAKLLLVFGLLFAFGIALGAPLAPGE